MASILIRGFRRGLPGKKEPPGSTHSPAARFVNSTFTRQPGSGGSGLLRFTLAGDSRWRGSLGISDSPHSGLLKVSGFFSGPGGKRSCRKPGKGASLAA